MPFPSQLFPGTEVINRAPRTAVQFLKTSHRLLKKVPESGAVDLLTQGEAQCRLPLRVDQQLARRERDGGFGRERVAQRSLGLDTPEDPDGSRDLLLISGVQQSGVRDRRVSASLPT